MKHIAITLLFVRRAKWLIGSAIVLALLLSTNFINVPASSAAPSPADQAKAYCQTQTGTDSGPLFSSCQKGYVGGLQFKAQKKPTKDVACGKGSGDQVNLCRSAYDAAINGSQGGTAPAAEDQLVNQICNGDKGSDRDSCVAGVKGFEAKKNKQDSCSETANKSRCGDAWVSAGGKDTATQISQDVQDHCKDDDGKALTGDELNGCVIGYQAAKNGDTDSHSCDDLSGSAKTRCQKTFDDNKQGGDQDDSEMQCNVTWDPLSWFMCPVVKGLVNIVDQLDDLITSQLSVGSPGNSSNPDQIFCRSGGKPEMIKVQDYDPDTGATKSTTSEIASCNAYKGAWSSFRNIALGLLVVVGLIVVISQALGFEFFDAYAIRKILPRLIFAAVAITLSWELMRFFVTFSNDLGFGVRYLIYEPFKHIQGGGLGGGGKAALAALSGAGILALGIVGLLSFAATAALAVAIAFLILVLRQLVIIILIILAPIAIVAYILPNTQNVYKLWWDSFAKALMIFPIIAAFIATGHVFSTIALANSDGALGEVIGFVAYFAPYFLLPLTFRFAGGALRGIGGFVNDRSRGGFDRLKNFRANQAKKNMADLAAGNRYKANNVVARGINSAGLFAATAPKAGTTPWKWKERYQGAGIQHEQHAISEYMEKSGAFAAIRGNDDLLQATITSMGGGKTESDWRRYLSGTENYTEEEIDQSVALIRAAKRDTNDDVFHTAAAIANFGTGTGYKEGGFGQAAEAIVEATHGNGAMRTFALAQGRQLAGQARSIDLSGAGFGSQAAALGQMTQAYHDIDARTDIDDTQKAQEKRLVRDSITRANNRKVTEVQSAGAIAGARGDSVKLLAPGLLDEVHEAYASGDEQTVMRTLAKVQKFHEAATRGGSHEVAQIFANDVMSIPIREGATITREVLDINGNKTGEVEHVPLTTRMIAERFSGNMYFNDVNKQFQSDVDLHEARLRGEAARAAEAAAAAEKEKG